MPDLFIEEPYCVCRRKNERGSEAETFLMGVL
jgi:hypothetical protein